MLMPILTARTPAQTAQSLPVEAGLSRDRLPALLLSASRAEAVLKILETLNRHLLGSEVLPKEALVKLMETLARILKFPSLPQETPQDFGRRLASYLERLPPEARVLLEKQLGQRNLALPMRLLAEILRNPDGRDVSRLQTALRNDGFPAGSARTDAGQQARPSLPIAALPAQHLAALTAGAASVTPNGPKEAALLQAVLRKAFGDAEQTPSETSDGDHGTESFPSAKRTGDTATKTGQPPQTGNTTTSLPLAGPSANPEGVPLLRAAAAFLAADPEALSLVTAIVQGETDPQGEIRVAAEAAVETSPQTMSAFDAGENPAVERMQIMATEKDATTKPDFTTGKMAQTASPDDPAETSFAGPGLEEQADDAGPTVTERQQEKPVRILAETLKALVQNSLTFAEGDVRQMAGPSNQTPSEGFAAGFATLQPAEAPGLEAMLEAALQEGEPGLTAEVSDQNDSWTAQVDAGQDETAEAHAAWTQRPKPDEPIRDALLQHRLAETMAGRDAVPFAIIPYLPAKAEDGLFAEPSEEQQASHDGEEADEQAADKDGNGDPPHQGEDDAVVSPPDTETDDTEDETAPDAHALYLRMGGLG